MTCENRVEWDREGKWPGSVCCDHQPSEGEGRPQELLEVGWGKDRPEVRMRREVCKKEENSGRGAQGPKSLVRTQGTAPPSEEEG